MQLDIPIYIYDEVHYDMNDDVHDNLFNDTNIGLPIMDKPV